MESRRNLYTSLTPIVKHIRRAPSTFSLIVWGQVAREGIARTTLVRVRATAARALERGGECPAAVVFALGWVR